MRKRSTFPAPAGTADAELVTAAVNALTDGNVTAFGQLLGHPDGAQVRDWRAGRVRLTATTRLFLRVAVAHPSSVRRWLLEAALT